jgi:predicted amidohydrolase YtcJ
MKQTTAFFLLFASLFIFSCRSTSKVDLLIYNAKIYTVDSSFSVAEAIAVRDGKIVAVGTTKNLRKLIFRITRSMRAENLCTPGL